MAYATPKDVSGSATSPRAGTPDLQRIIVLHDGGDAILVIGSDTASQQPVMISKTTMTMASPVWKAMFERHWRENEATEIPLPDDDVEAMLLVLRIAHLRFHELPKKNALTLDALLNLAVICDKYDLVKIVRPFLDLHGWASCYIPNIGYGIVSDPCWLFIAWTFGYKDSFEQLATYTVRMIRVDSLGDAIMEDGRRFPEDTPPGLLERMMVIRKNTLTDMLNTLYQTLDKILAGPVCKVNDSRTHKVPEISVYASRRVQETVTWDQQCRAMILGSYVSFLVNGNLYPLRRTAVDITLSIKDLDSLVQAAELLTFESHDYMKIQAAKNPPNQSFGYHAPTEAEVKALYIKGLGVISHKCCTDAFEFRSQIRQYRDGTPSPVLESHRRHMDTQALK